MDFVTGIVVGLLIGLLLHWVVEPLLTTRQATGTDLKDYHTALANLKQRVDTLEAGLTPSGGGVSQAITRIIVKDRDDLTRINGIGPVFSKRLYQSGIHTYEQLAHTRPGRLRQIVASEDWQDIDVDDWIEEASQLAADPTRTSG